MKAKILLLLGDTAGIGPEVCAKAAEDLPDEAQSLQIILTGDIRVFKEAQQYVHSHLDMPCEDSFDAIEKHNENLVFWNRQTEDISLIKRRAVDRIAGREVLNSLKCAINLAQKKRIEGFVFAPFNKESMVLGGSEFMSELEMFKTEFNRPDITGEFNVIDDLWLARVTSHIAVSDISRNLSIDNIKHCIELMAFEQLKFSLSPKLAVAALNPHAGEHGMFGDEEGRLISPAIEAVRKEHSDWIVDGPIPSDTLFPRAMKGGYTGIIGMYHDQLQIASKLIGMERGVTYHPGMAVPIATAAHGTAFDLQGSGRANHHALKNAIAFTARMIRL